MEENKLKNLAVCTWVYDNVRKNHIVNEQKTNKENMKNEIGEMSFNKLGFANSINFNISIYNQQKYFFAAVEHSTENKVYVSLRIPLQLDQIYVYKYTL